MALTKVTADVLTLSANVAIDSPVFSNTATGTYTLGGTPTINSPVLSGTATGTYTLGGTPTISSPTVTGTTSFPDGSAAAPSIFRAGDTNTGFYFPAADTVNFAEGGTGYRVGFRNVSAVGTKTSSYTLAVADVGKYVQVGSGGSITIPDATFAEGDVISIFNNTSGNITITCTITTAYIAGTDTDKASVTLATRGVATILFISGTVCVITGNVS